ncbi:hypothetical protein EGW08_013917, partial [Elysia chlorotica]
MAAFGNPNDQVSIRDNDWCYSRSDTVDVFDERGKETFYTNGSDRNPDIQRETTTDNTERTPSFDATIEELDLDTNRGSAEPEDNMQDEISPAIQISKTFSLATFGTHPHCNEQPSPVQGDRSHQESYKLTNLDTETESTENNNESVQRDGEPCQIFKEEQEKQNESVNNFTPRYKNKRGKKPIGCHVIDLETFSTSQSSSEHNDMGSQTPCVSADKNLDSPIIKTKDELSTPTKLRSNFFSEHSYGIDTVNPDAKQSEPYSFNRHTAYYSEDSKFMSYDFNFSTPNSGHVEMGSYYLPSDNGEYSVYNYGLEQMAADSGESEETSDMVIDLNDRMPVDSGIFEASLTRPNTFANFVDSQISTPSTQPSTFLTQGYARQTNYPLKMRETFIPEGTNSSGNLKARISFFHDRQITNSPQACQRKSSLGAYEIPYHASRDTAYYDEMMNMREPFVTDECGYMYQQDHGASFLGNRAMPCSSWESTTAHKTSYNPMINDMADESEQGMWYPDGLTNLFESREPPDIAHYTHPSTIKDEEETDDADETGYMPETADTSYSYLSQGQERSSSYLSSQSPQMARFNTATLTPPPSESSTPNPPSNHGFNDDMSMYQWGPLPSSCSLPEYTSSETMNSMSPLQHSCFQSSYNHASPDYLDANLLSFGSQKGIARPFPSMADAYQPGHAYSPSRYSSTETGSKKSDQITKRRGKYRRTQIQSHKISTSTPKDTKSFRDSKSQLAPVRNSVAPYAMGCGKIKHQTKEPKAIDFDRVPRHNEPLKQRAVDVMTRWYEQNIHNPYPTKAQKTAMAQEGQISENQVKSWFANKRNRTHNTKPKVQKRAMEE